jgi:hypothetical protein
VAARAVASLKQALRLRFTKPYGYFSSSAIDTTGNQAVMPDMIEGFANVAREKLGLKEAVIGGITCAHWRSASRSPIPKFASWDQNQNSCERLSPLQA